MCDAGIDVLDDDSLYQIFGSWSLFNQIRASKVCRRWYIVCQRVFKRVKNLIGDGHTWKFIDENGMIFTETADSEVVKTVLASCGQYIQKLKLNGKQIPSDTSACLLIMSIITARCGNLRFIYLEQIYKDVILRLIPIIIQRNKNLSALRLEHIYYWNMYDIVKHLPKRLLEFQILNVSPTDPNVLIEVLKSCPNLMSFACNVVKDKVAESIGSLEYLEYLGLKFSFTDPFSFFHVAKLKNLVWLDLEKCIFIEDQTLHILGHELQQLEGLIISTCIEITNFGISGLTNLERLRELRMRELQEVTDASIANLPVSLQVLCCCGCVEVMDKGVIRFLTRAKNLRVLCITDCQITTMTIEAAIRIVKDQESSRNLKIYAGNILGKLGTINENLIAELPPLLQVYLKE